MLSSVTLAGARCLRLLGGFLVWGYDFEKLKDILAKAVCGLFLE